MCYRQGRSTNRQGPSLVNWARRSSQESYSGFLISQVGVFDSFTIYHIVQKKKKVKRKQNSQAGLSGFPYLNLQFFSNYLHFKLCKRNVLKLYPFSFPSIFPTPKCSCTEIILGPSHSGQKNNTLANLDKVLFTN